MRQRQQLFIHLENKQTLRMVLFERRAAWGQAKRASISAGITEQILESAIYSRAKTIFTYVSTDQEIDTHRILQHALSVGKRVCVPRCIRQGEMQAYHIDSMQELHPGKYGILEPEETAMQISPGEINLILVPALACDLHGYRLGYGGGYYDRYLMQTGAVTAALCAEENLLRELPHERFDQRCGWVFTEGQVRYTDEKQ